MEITENNNYVFSECDFPFICVHQQLIQDLNYYDSKYMNFFRDS